MLSNYDICVISALTALPRSFYASASTSATDIGINVVHAIVCDTVLFRGLSTAPIWMFDAILGMPHGDSIFDYRSVSSSSLPIYLCHGDRYWYHQCNLVERHSHRYDAATYRSRLMNTGAQWSTHCKSHLLMPLPSGCKRFFVGRACLTTCSAVGSS